MIYLDNSATTKPSEAIMTTFIQANERFYANPASLHEMGVASNSLLSRSRQQIADLLKTTEQQIVFTSGGSESNNFIIKGLANANTHRGKHILVSAVEHASVLESARMLEESGFEVDYVKVDHQGVIDMNDFKEKLRKDTVVVSVMHVNNEVGAIQPIQAIAALIHQESRAFFHVDAVQSFGKLTIDFQGEYAPDAISISGHKLHAFKGSGIAAFKKLFTIDPLIHGGGQEMGLRSGTVAVPQNVALAKAMRLASEMQVQQVEKYKDWRDELHAFLAQFRDVYTLSTNAGAPHIVSCSVADIKGEVMINAMQSQQIIVSTSSACHSKDSKVSHVVTAMGIPDEYARGVIRISFGQMTTQEHIESFKNVFENVLKQVKGEVKKYEMV
ncbi:cysteine desulfurase family protein [Kurthia sibirica]|uniref:Aminotransferase n=1 Tax=Kurthia sibirica TaxID=202750 RepID=A0A2U3ANU8_9BACL|nr:cysteine desulfurase family protein [Kurthia sibirica]PWI26223.1 aminotransferase [Kurthia sibirica]GEK35530.1 aminotransferase [Kurthia sibirica]